MKKPIKRVEKRYFVFCVDEGVMWKEWYDTKTAAIEAVERDGDECYRYRIYEGVAVSEGVACGWSWT